MTDDKKDLEDIDWDQALAEWENKSFVPEVAKEPQTNKPGVLAGTTGSRPLYRPPVLPVRSKPQLASVPSQRPAPAPPVALAPPPAPLPPSEASFDDQEDDGATLIAAIPEELLRAREELATKSSRAGGGLGQLFSRDAPRRQTAPRSAPT